MGAGGQHVEIGGHRAVDQGWGPAEGAQGYGLNATLSSSGFMPTGAHGRVLHGEAGRL